VDRLIYTRRLLVLLWLYARQPAMPAAGIVHMSLRSDLFAASAHARRAVAEMEFQNVAERLQMSDVPILYLNDKATSFSVRWQVVALRFTRIDGAQSCRRPINTTPVAQHNADLAPRPSES
jgi:hypothetical protein